MTVIIDGTAGITFPVTAGSASAVQASSGRVLQVVQGSLTTTVSISNTAQGTLTDVGLSASITPSSSTSKILVMVTMGAISANSNDFAFHLIRGSTEIGQSTTAASGSNGTGILGATGAEANMPIPASITYLDSPATTSATTYKMQVNNTNGSAQTVTINRRSSDTTYTMASYMTLMEIAA